MENGRLMMRDRAIRRCGWVGQFSLFIGTLTVAAGLLIVRTPPAQAQDFTQSDLTGTWTFTPWRNLRFWAPGNWRSEALRSMAAVP